MFVLIGDGHPAAATLRHLVAKGASVSCVFATAGAVNRGALTGLCADNEIPLFDSDILETRVGIDAVGRDVDWILNINSTVLLPDSILQLGKSGALNMHPGLLPEYAGLHTHQWAIRNGESVFGVTVHQMVPAVDAGEIVLRRTFEVGEAETGLSLYLKCMEHGIEAFGQVIDTILSGAALETRPQDLTRRTLYRHADALDGNVDWNLNATEIERLVRAGTYTPLSSPSFTPTIRLTGGAEIQVLEVAIAPGPPPSGAVPGFVLVSAADVAPQVVCGEDTLITLRKATYEGVTLHGPEIQEILPSGQRLR